MLDDSFRLRYKAVPLAISFTDKASGNTPVHNHIEFEMLLITKGTSTVTINNTSYIAQKGDIFFINPLEIHSVTKSDSDGYAHKCICFDCSLISDNKIKDSLLDGTLHIINRIDNQSPYSGIIKKYFLNIIESHIEDSDYVKTEISAYISLLFAYLMKQSLADFKSVKSKNTIFCSKVFLYILEHYSEDITSKQIAEALSYNQSYFCRNFKKNFSCSFSDYLTTYRISMARIFLEEGKCSVTDIALKCGFNTPSYFTKCFKKSFGILPSEYIKSQHSL